jgi:hypothetical protein
MKIGLQDRLLEKFTYDNLDRLTSSTVSGQSAVNISSDYNGNMLSKTGVGSYEYFQDKIVSMTCLSVGEPKEALA